MNYFFGFSFLLFVSSFSAFGEWEPVRPKDNSAALERLRDQALPKEFRRTSVTVTTQEFQSRLKSLKQWQASLYENRVEILCLGESHKKNYRDFIAQHLLPELKITTLALEMKDSEVAEIVAAAQRGEEVPWLGAPLGDIIRAVKGGSPQALLFGLEPNESQRKAQLVEGQLDPVDRQLTRDGFLALNFFERYVPQRLNLILYGSNHCAKNDLALFDRTLMKRLMLKNSSQAKSVLLIPRSDMQNPLVAYMGVLNMAKGTWVLDNFKDLDPSQFNDRFEVMKYQQNFDTVVFFQDR